MTTTEQLLLPASAPQLYTLRPLMVRPGLAVLVTTLAFNLLRDGLRNAFDPRSTLEPRGGRLLAARVVV